MKDPREKFTVIILRVSFLHLNGPSIHSDTLAAIGVLDTLGSTKAESHSLGTIRQKHHLFTVFQVIVRKR